MTSRSESGDGALPDPHTAERVRVHERFERSMAEKGLLEEDGRLALEPEDVIRKEPPGTEQTAG